MALDPERMLSHLMGDVAVLRKRLDGLDELEVPERLAMLDQGLRQVVEQISHVGQLLQELQEEPEEPEEDFDPTAVRDFLTLNQEEAEATWKWLVDWLRKVLRPAYLGAGANSPWRPCWYQHRRVLLELIWAAAFWHWSYAKGAPPSRAAEWHTRWLPHLETFLAKQFAGCGAGETYTPPNGGKPRMRVHQHPEKYVTAFAFPYSVDHQPEPWELDPERKWRPVPLDDFINGDINRRPLADQKKGTTP
ncbi:hypothetical protein ACFQ0M_48810 [Kitasatospora aburaviensis]|uniref:DUF4913 domain-containing protein n=1 Tax=Kitasatospora aburaviensis TaxID=67265 RepID=A0ABW1F448_9ACTN